MVAAEAQSVLVYLACVNKFTLTRLFVKDPSGELCEAEMSTFDHIFLTFYVMAYLFFSKTSSVSLNNSQACFSLSASRVAW